MKASEIANQWLAHIRSHKIENAVQVMRYEILTSSNENEEFYQSALKITQGLLEQDEVERLKGLIMVDLHLMETTEISTDEIENLKSVKREKEQEKKYLEAKNKDAIPLKHVFSNLQYKLEKLMEEIQEMQLQLKNYKKEILKFNETPYE